MTHVEIIDADVPTTAKASAPRTLTKIVETTPLAAPADETGAFLAMIERAASNPAVDVDKFERLLALREKIERQAAMASFNIAVAKAKGEIGPIVKDKTVDFTSQKGRTNYKYEGFDTIGRVVDPILDKHGLSYRFRAAQEGQKLRVTCILSRGGYAEETTLEAPEDHSGNKNPIQAIGSSATYLQRMTLKLALGLATSNDDDGRAAYGSAGGSACISQEQIEALQSLIVEVGADVNRFFAFLKINRLDDLPASRFQDAIECLKKKGARQ